MNCTEDLVAERAAARVAIEFFAPMAVAWAFEAEPASSKPLLNSYIDAVTTSDPLVLILGQHLTAPVRAEYDTALDHAKQLLVFCKAVPEFTFALADQYAFGVIGPYCYILASYRQAKVSYSMAMTIAAGFVARDGILLCTDSQLTSAGKTYSPKIIRETFPVGRSVTFALSGEIEYAKSAIYDAFKAVRDLPSDAGIWAMRKAIRKAVRNCERERKALRDPGDYSGGSHFLIAITTASERVLFSSREAAMPSVQTYACIGSGSYLGHYIATLLRPDVTMPIWGLVPIALQMIVAAKRHDAYCGGGSHFMAIRETEGRGDFYDQSSDVTFHDYERFSGELLLSMSQANLTADEFHERLGAFTERVTALRTSMHRSNSMYRQLVDYLSPADRPGPLPPTSDS